MKKTLAIFVLAYSAFLATEHFSTKAQVPFPGGGSGGGGGFISPITQTLAAPAATVTFASIPGTSKNIRFSIQAASSVVATSDNMIMQFNADTGINYNSQETFGNNATTTTSAAVLASASPLIGSIAGSTGVATEAGSLTIFIPNYSGATFLKDATSQGFTETADSAAGLFGYIFSFHWKSTSAITQVLFKLSSGSNFIPGSQFVMYLE